MKNIERKALLESLIAKIRGNESLSKRELKRALTTDEWDKYEFRAEYYKPSAKVPKHVIRTLQPYLVTLRKAECLDRRADARSRKSHLPPEAYTRGLFPKIPLCIRAEMAYERALSILAELIDVNPEFQIYFDRPLNFKKGFDFAPEGPPRLRTSRSPHTLHEGREKRSQRALICDALQGSLKALESQSPTVSAKPAFAFQSIDSDELDGLGWHDDQADNFGFGDGLV